MATNAGIHKKVYDYLNRCLEKASKMEFVLQHVNLAQRATRIWAGKWDGTSDAKEFASQILEEASNYCAVAGNGAQRYAISAYDIDRDADSPGGSLPFMNCGFIHEGVPQPFGNGDFVSSEPPTSEGMLAQFMRHNQAMFQQNNAVISSLVSHLATSLDKKSQENERLMADRVNTITIMEELLSRKHERDMEVKHQEAKIQRGTEMWQKLTEIMPIAINKIAGKEIVRQKSTAFEATTMAFMESIKAEQLDVIAKSGVFSERQLVLFGTLLEQMVKQMVTAQEKQETAETANKAVVGDIGDVAMSAMSNALGG